MYFASDEQDIGIAVFFKKIEIEKRSKLIKNRQNCYCLYWGLYFVLASYSI